MNQYLEDLKTKAERKSPGASQLKSKTPYLHLDFKTVDKPLVVEVADGVNFEFEITNWKMADDGVGAFEYHGFQGNHTRPYVLVTGLTLVFVNGRKPEPALVVEVERDFKRNLITADCAELP